MFSYIEVCSMGGYRSVDYGLICGRTSPQRLPVITRLLTFHSRPVVSEKSGYGPPGATDLNPERGMTPDAPRRPLGFPWVTTHHRRDEVP